MANSATTSSQWPAASLLSVLARDERVTLGDAELGTGMGRVV